MTEKLVIKTFLWVVFFSIAMGFLETSVVVYLRKIYYPAGFNFPLVPIDGNIAVTEILREAATLIMLIAIGILAGRTKTEKFAYFLLSFAIWDIFYYIFLKILIGWPQSWLTWDILFLIPVTWVGPVVAPVILSAIMIFFAVSVIVFTNKTTVKISPAEWLLLIAGSFVVIISFTEDYVGFLLKEYSWLEIIKPENKTGILSRSMLYVPETFSWLIFSAGTVLILAGLWIFYKRNTKHNR